MTPKQKKLIENYVRIKVKSMLKEEVGFDGTDMKLLLGYINGLARNPSLNHSINDKTLISLDDKIRGLRIQMMKYIEENSDYKFLGTGNGFKLVKK